MIAEIIFYYIFAGIGALIGKATTHRNLITVTNFALTIVLWPREYYWLFKDESKLFGAKEKC
jgi:hypothetical protein